MVAAAMAPEALLGRYGQLTVERAKLSDLIETSERQLSALEGEKQRLLPRIADGDKAASSRADQIDSQKVQLEREIGGRKIRLNEMTAAIAELNEPRKAILQKRVDEAKAKRFAEAKEFVETKINNFAARYRAMCRERFELGEELHKIGLDPMLDEAQKSFLLSFVIANQMQVTNTARVNERWEPARALRTPLQLPIMASKPPHDKRNLEILS
jgi:chromosome segregation ATPase